MRPGKLTHRSAERRLREIARSCVLFALMLMIAATLARDTFPDAGWVRALTWPAFASALTLVVVGRWVVGREVNWNDYEDAPRYNRVAWHLVGLGVAVLATFVIGRFGFDRAAARVGGVPGLMGSNGILMAGLFLFLWGIYRPRWLFMPGDDDSDLASSSA